MTRSPARSQLIARWDLDKTYLRTEFDTLRDLVRTALQAPEDKRAVPGASCLLREIGSAGARVHILSGSPKQMRNRLAAKLRLDEVQWHELTLKPNLNNLLRLRLRALRDQLGYKLPELLEARLRDQERPETHSAQEVLVGDDAEADAFVYSLYADIVAGDVPPTHLGQILRAGRLYTDQRERCLRAAERLRAAPIVRCILIHLDRQSPPSRFASYGPRVVPFYNYLQAGFVLFARNMLDDAAFVRLTTVMLSEHFFQADELARSIRELAWRHHAPSSEIHRAAQVFAESNTDARLSRIADYLERYLESSPDSVAPQPKQLDYVALAKQHRSGHRRWSRYASLN